MRVGKSAQLTAAVFDAKHTALVGRNMTWSTSDTAIATADAATGLVTAIAPGSATISVAVDGVKQSLSLIVLPAPVSFVVVTVDSTSLQINETAQATAVTLDDDGNMLTGRRLTWASSNPAVASISALGVVTAIRPGTTSISASAEGASGPPVQLTVTRGNPAEAPQITAVTPSPMVEGQTATITGSKFSPTPGDNIVRVGDVVATVTAASSTSLQIIVPNKCRPAQAMSIEITVGPNVSDQKPFPFTPSTTFTLAQGKQRLIADPADFCLQFPATTADEWYLIGVQSVVESAASLTAVNFAAETPTGSNYTGTSSAIRRTPGFSPSLAGAVASPFAGERAERLARHRAVEAQLLAQERALLAPRLRSSSAARVKANPSKARMVATVPATAKVGDVVSMRVPKVNDSTCQLFTPIAATVKAVGTSSIILEDNANPSGGLSVTDYQTLSTQFDAQIYATDAAYFGTPTDFDGNGRIAIVITKEVNKTANLLGVVFFANFFDQTECASSNEGEFFYGKAPDPNGTVGDTYSVADARVDAPVIIAHELTHVIQVGRRIEFTAPNIVLQSPWELEGQATFAEEVNGFAATGLGPAQNLGLDVVTNDPRVSPNDWFIDAFGDLFVYFGLGTSRTTKILYAPEQCSWLAPQGPTNNGPCLPDYAMYGASWSFLRWLSDQFGPTFPGGEKGLHQKLVDNSFSGFATIANVVGVPIDVLLSQWAAALYTDDRAPGLDPRLSFTSWNLTVIEGGVIEPARLAPRERGFRTFSDQVAVRGGSTAYFVLSGQGRPATGIRARDVSTDGPLPSGMRMWVVRLR